MANPLQDQIGQQPVETRIETYIPLYRKYRPQSFADMVGQEAIVQTLANAINLNKVAHAYLFCGPRGTGKTSSARIFAKSLNCEHGPTITPCQQCATCVGITDGNALDVIEFDAASNNGVNDARELIENCQYTSMTGRFKVYIIDEVHMLTPQAFNALLKTLEEPPPNVIFIFATTEAHKVLPTIISRCQRFDFNRITNENIVDRLKYIANQENIRIDDEALMMIARHARGGMRDAVGLLDQVAVLGRAQTDKIIGRKDVALFIGTLEEDLLLRLGAAIAERRAADLLNELNELVNRGIEPVQLLKDLTVHFRNLLLVKAAGANAKPELLSLPPDYFEQLVEQARLFKEDEELPQVIARLSFVERNIRNTQQPQLWLEVGLIELAYRHEIFMLKELSERVAQLEAQLAGGAVPPVPAQPVQPRMAQQPAPATPAFRPAMEPPAPAQPTFARQPEPSSRPAAQSMSALPAQPAAPAGGIDFGSLNGIYARICDSVASLTTKSLLKQQTFPLSLEEDRLIIGCASEPTLNLLKKPDKFIHLQKAVDAQYGRPIKIDVVLEKQRPAGAAQPAKTPAAGPPAQPAMAAPAEAPPAQSVAPMGTPAMTAPVQSAPSEASAAPVLPEAPFEFFGGDEPDVPDFDDEDDEEAADAAGPAATPGGATTGPMSPQLAVGDEDLADAKKYTMDLLQGKILE